MSRIRISILALQVRQTQVGDDLGGKLPADGLKSTCRSFMDQSLSLV